MPSTAVTARATEAHSSGQDTLEMAPPEQTTTTATSSLASSTRLDARPSEETTSVAAWQHLRRLLYEWLADDSGYDEETWPKLKAALEQDRLSARSLFDE